MQPMLPKSRQGPEAKIQADIIDFLRVRGWYTKIMHGNVYQQGVPDLYICHPKYRSRWVEVKNAAAYSFTPAQLEFFPQLASCGIGVYILTGATEEEYMKLFSPPNWWQYLAVSKPYTRQRKSRKEDGTYIPKYPCAIDKKKD